MPQSLRLPSHDDLLLAADAHGDASAQPILLSHGGGQTRHAWSGSAERLAEAGFYAISADLRGHGESAWSADDHYRLDDFAGDVIAFQRHLGKPPIAVGASLGGLASLLAQAEPDAHFRALVLVDIAPRMEQTGVERIFQFMQAHPEGFASLEEAADHVASYLPHRERPRDLSGLEKNLRRGADGRWRWHWDPRFLARERYLEPQILIDKLEHAARQIRVPTLLVRGRASDVLSEAAAEAFRALVPHAEYLDVTDAAHMVAGDRNDRFSEAVIDFVRRVAPEARGAA